MNELIYAIIPARSGSKGVPNKNTKLLNGYPLIAYSIAAAKSSKYISRVIVSTDDVEYCKIANFFGAETPFLRPKEISTDQSTDRDFFLHLLNFLISADEPLPKYLLHLRPTTPLRDTEVLNKAIEYIATEKTSSSLRSAHECSESPFKWFLKENIFYKPISNSILSEDINAPRQSFPKVYIPNGYVDILSSKFILNERDIHGENILAYETPHCTEIDTFDDFNFLEYQLSKTNCDSLTYLKENFKL